MIKTAKKHKGNKTMEDYSRRRFLRSAAAVLGTPLFSSFLKPGDARPPSDAPNIVFLFSDDHSVPDLGCYGNPVVHTPNLDRMAAEGVRFNRAYVSSSQCSPSRASVLTGRPAHQVNASRLHADVPVPEANIVRLLNNRGYYTGGYRKIHQSNIKDELQFYADDPEPLATFFEDRPKDRPFFLWFGCRDPHRKYGPGAFDPPHKPKNVIVPDYLPDTPEVRQDLAYYYDEIARFDRECGEIMEFLEQQGVSDETMVVMAGDNGLPFPRAKATLYEPGIHVPLLVKYPDRVGKGRVSDALVSVTDLAATWLEAAGIDVPESMTSRSLMPLLTGETEKVRDFVFAERNWHDNWDPMRCVVGKRYKLIQNYRPEVPYYPSLDLAESPTYGKIKELKKEGGLSGPLKWYQHSSRPQVEFYDLDNDPGEWTNLSGQAAQEGRITKYQEQLDRWMIQTNDFLPPPKSAFPSEELNETINPLDGKPY